MLDGFGRVSIPDAISILDPAEYFWNSTYLFSIAWEFIPSKPLRQAAGSGGLTSHEKI